MKNYAKVIIAMIFAAAIPLAFYAGSTLKEKEVHHDRRQRCQTLLSFAVDKLDNQGLSEQGVREALISDLYAAYEYCDTPNLAAEIHTIWNTLLFNPIEDENALSMQLKTLSDAMKNGE